MLGGDVNLELRGGPFMAGMRAWLPENVALIEENSQKKIRWFEPLNPIIPIARTVLDSPGV